MMVN